MRALEQDQLPEFGLPLVSIRLRLQDGWNDISKAMLVRSLQNLVELNAYEVRVDLYSLADKWLIFVIGFLISIQQKSQFAQLSLSIRVRPEHHHVLQVMRLGSVLRVEV